jgi:hypothetical protein
MPTLPPTERAKMARRVAGSRVSSVLSGVGRGQRVGVAVRSAATIPARTSGGRLAHAATSWARSASGVARFAPGVRPRRGRDCAPGGASRWPPSCASFGPRCGPRCAWRCALVGIGVFSRRFRECSGVQFPPAPFDSAEDGLAHGGPFLVESCFASHHVRRIQITSKTRSKRLCTPLKTSTSSGSKWVPAQR